MQHLPSSSHQGAPLISVTFQDDGEWPQYEISQLSQHLSEEPMGSHGCVREKQAKSGKTL